MQQRFDHVIHDEVFERCLIAERALLIAFHLDGDDTPIRAKRDRLRHLAAGCAQAGRER